jgi:uncharacterized membrane protein YcjF (UPF0283 family)
MDKMHEFRQPMVTAVGILLGFILNFASSWVRDAFSKHLFREFVIAISLALCIALLVIVLYRILSMHYPKDRAEEYYKKTLTLFIVGITLPFVTIIYVMIENIILNIS